MDDLNVPIFSQAKLEYTKQLVDVLYMNMYDGVRSIYDDAKVLYVKQRKPITSIFRKLLEQVPKWNTEVIEAETERIERASKCDWLDDLLTAVFISHTRILMSIGTNQNYNRINVTIPKTTTFIHKAYINIAREVWKNPYLFDESILGHEYQRNMKQLEDMIKLTIEDTIRRQLPIKEILREHLENYDEPVKQQPQQQLDMKTLVEELRKAGMQGQQAESEPVDKPDSPEESDNEPTSEQETKPDFNSLFTKEEELDNETPEETEPIIVESSEPPVTESTTAFDNYTDPDDPDESQIQKATQNIVLNDITEPVIEQTYENVDIVSPTKKDTNPDKLNNMIKELTTTTPVKKDQDKPTSVVKIDSDQTPTNEKTDSSIVKLTKQDSVPIFPEPPAPEPQAPEPQAPPTETKSSPFSFDSLYSTITGKGKVEEVKEEPIITPEPAPEPAPEPEPEPEPEPKFTNPGTIVIKEDIMDPKPDPESTKQANSDIMKEVISLDKKEEQIDETISLDNFFTDVKKMADPMNTMEPIQEESKYTLFEDATQNE